MAKDEMRCSSIVLATNEILELYSIFFKVKIIVRVLSSSAAFSSQNALLCLGHCRVVFTVYVRLLQGLSRARFAHSYLNYAPLTFSRSARETRVGGRSQYPSFVRPRRFRLCTATFLHSCALSYFF